MDSNNMYQNQQNAGGEPENNQNPYGQDQNYQDPYNQNTNYQQYSYNNNGNYQTPYNQGAYNQAPQVDLEEPVKMSEWLISFLIMMIPCVNIIMPFVWAFSGNEKKSKSNFFKASPIMAAIGIVLWFIFIIAIAALGGTVWMNLWRYY